MRTKKSASALKSALKKVHYKQGVNAFSLDLINFSGVDSLHMIYSAVLAGIPQSLQSRQNALVYSLIREFVNSLVRGFANGQFHCMVVQ